MEFYYSIRGDASKHGTATKSELEEMAKKGTLRPVDLVWDSSKTAGWVPASTLKGLFPKPEPEKQALSVKANAVEPDKAPPAPRQKSSRKKRRPAGALIAASVGLVAVVGAFLIWQSTRPDADDGTLTTVTTTSTSTTQPAPKKDYGALLAEASGAVADNDLDAALPLIDELIQQDDYRAQAFDLTRKLDPLKQWDVRRQQMERMIMQGLVTRAMANDFADEVAAMGKKDDMQPLLDAVMARPEVGGDAASSAVKLYAAMKLNSQIYRVLMSYTQLALETNNADNLVMGTRLLSANGGEQEALAKLRKFTSVNTEAASVHIELAAILASTDDSKAAMSELKKAAKINESLTRNLARSDSRFDPMRDSWSFKRLLKD